MRRMNRGFAVILSALIMCTAAAGCGSSSPATVNEKDVVQTQEAVNVEETALAEVEETALSSAGATAEKEDKKSGADSTESEAVEEAEKSSTGETASEAAATDMTAEEEKAAADATDEKAEEEQTSFDGDSDLEFNARMIMESDDSITLEGALGVSAYLWQMGFGRMKGYPVIGEVDGAKVLTVYDEDGLFYNIVLTDEGKIERVEDVQGNELISLGTKAGEMVKPPISGDDIVALLQEWKGSGGHSKVVAYYNKYAGDYGTSKMDSGDQWCSETVSAAYAALGVADKIGGMSSNGNSYESKARSVGAWVSDKGYIPSAGDILITHDSAGERHTYCVTSCDGHTIHTIAGGGSSIHNGSISVGSGRITGFVVPEW